jgi:Raf kinase inhibitor-like YbhB/YbcL family protein
MTDGGLRRTVSRLLLAVVLGAVVTGGLTACSDGDDSADSTSTTRAPGRPAGEGGAEADAPPGEPVVAMTMTTPAFGDGELIPTEFTCSGAGTAPELRWSEPPVDVEQLALVVNDPDARGGEGFVHYVGWGIDPDARRLTAAGYAAATLGANGAGQQGWVPPCPPPGEEPHRYEFTIYGLGGPPAVEAGADRDDLLGAIGNRVLSQATVTGRFGR